MIRRLARILILTLGIGIIGAACAYHSKTDRQLVQLREDFFKDTGKKDVGFVHLQFSDGLIFENAIGVCWLGISIDIDKKWWEKSAKMPFSRRSLVYHELGHCVCNLQHTEEDDIMLDGCSSSIMHPTIQNEFCLFMHWEFYMNDLYSRCND